MRALAPDVDDVLDRDGFHVGYAVYGHGDVTVCLVMPDTIVHARAWKGQVPFLARYCRVVTIDPRGNGSSDRPTRPEQFAIDELLADVWAILDHVGADQVVLGGLCSGAGLSTILAAERPERVLGVFAINPGLALTPPHPHKLRYDFEVELDTDEGWARSNRHYWLRDWPGFAEFFFTEMFPEPHSTKQIEDTVGWATETTPETMLIDHDCDLDPRFSTGAEEVCRRVRCPVLVVSGSLDMCQVPERGRRLAELTGGEFVLMEGSGHLPNARDPVKINLLLRDFVLEVAVGRGGRALAPVTTPGEGSAAIPGDLN
jgi:pimeloyl-ACP methyl ester carboxylesterase